MDTDSTTTPLPHRPTRAQGVEPSGKMPESGFQDQQWLIQRDGTFIQVSELIYRITELADGSRTSAEIAAELSRLGNRQLLAEHVDYLIGNKLLPLGLIASDRPATAARVPAASSLGFTVKHRLMGPETLERSTKALHNLFHPAIMVPVLALVAIAHFWLYLSQDIGMALQTTLLTPGWLLAVIAIYLVSGLVHELGHAAALRHGGGRARALGLGIYIVYPAFYTDTTDSYRLGRSERITTDLGGFYFHLIFALGLMGAYLLSGETYLLVTILLINLDILIQCIPFFRFDGYWALNDFTGVPDFFSQMAPFARSLIPGSKGSRLPQLKPWAKAIFVGYMLLTLPLLIALLAAFAIRLPRFVTLAWTAVQNQLGAFANASAAAAYGTMAASLAQLAILALPLLAVPYLLYRLLWRPVSGLWRRRTRHARMAAVLLVAAVTAVAGFYWFPRTAAVLAGAAVPDGLSTFTVERRGHVEQRVDYPETPPVGGDHAPVWQNCGYYESEVADENAVHSLEHGAVWITYRPQLAAGERAALRELSQGRTHVLVSPVSNLPAPVVASAWGRQLQADSARDPRLAQFVAAFHLGRQAPERGAPCRGGEGEPAQ